MASLIPHLFLLLMPFLVNAQSNSIINTGSFLIAGDVSTSPWLSPSKDFAFGFRELENGLFLLCIWYNKLPEKTVVWFARHDQNPAPRGSKVELTALDGLLLRESRGGTSKLIGLVSGTVASAVMNDTGNLMLKDSDSMLLWESFKQPTDTLLPTQKMEINDILSSYKSYQNYSLGKFHFQLWKGNAVLNIRNLPTGNMYESYDTIRATNGYEIVFDKDGVLYIMQRDGNRVNISEPEGDYPADIHYYKVTINFDGVLTVSHYPKNPTTSSNAAWKDFKKMPDNICMAMRGELSSGICGYNSICTLNDDQRPRCKCPTGYSFMDLNDTYSNCVANIPQICEEGAQNSTDDLYSLQELPNTDWPMLDYERYNPFSAEECKKACLLDCLCVVAVYRDNTCWKKKLPLSNGREDSKEISVSFLKLRRNTSSTGKTQDGFPIPEGKKNQQTLIVVISVLLGCSLFVILILASMICWGFISCNKKKLAAGNILPSESFESNNLCQFTYKELSEATNGFKEELGRGSCGIVYKGRIKTGVVAVKQLDRVFEDSEKEFRTEVNVIGQTHHKNLVRLLGYCNEGRYHILVYEFMSNGTLADLLFGDGKPSWNLRTQIAYGIARGLMYLHEECDKQIIHCDIKPQNVLLDEHYNAKIADFGLAKLLKMDQSRTETGIRGTKGYVAPDWFRSAQVTAKVDVYSFGVQLLEIICCRRNGDMNDFEGGQELLVDWAYDCFQQGRLDVLVEEDLEAMDDMRRLETFVMVAIWCLQEDPSQRPTMKRVTWMLEGIAPVSVPPNPNPFTSNC
ncbi:G-type lectin S-receptor-like serine/threonine-protein kinase LECRK1 [Cucurbita pepo subsp. pepo]|uniref:G-type lectin S-receptor-like serine/threonine-protein kinase LECRK1 n=1 Tax=Cucurbita pepo subsp. pepo TaxID=3664 RepID=UPI000C9D413A|nr:G-type lectin S-receptor-like serine/threonine-protein kinase LECRK1 [Cucurbita pepo subsp. pepo]